MDGTSVRSGQSEAQTLAINVNALRAGLEGLPPGQEEIVLEVDEDGVQHINTSWGVFEGGVWIAELRRGCGHRYCIRSRMRLSTAPCSGFIKGGTRPHRIQ